MTPNLRKEKTFGKRENGIRSIAARKRRPQARLAVKEGRGRLGAGQGTTYRVDLPGETRVAYRGERQPRAQLKIG